MALSGMDLDQLVKPDLRAEWELEKERWFPRPDHYPHDIREPGK